MPVKLGGPVGRAMLMQSATHPVRDAPIPAPASAPATPAAVAASTPPTGVMDRDFIEKNQIVERYLSGRLPPRGVTEFERFCATHPELLDQLGLPERVHAGLRLLETAGHPEPWAEPAPKAWQKPGPLIGAVAAALALLVATVMLGTQSASRGTRIALLEKRLADQPLEPITATRTLRLVPSRGGPTSSPAATVGGAGGELADLKFDMSWARYAQFRVTIDREGQGRVAMLHSMARDSNGDVRLAFNTSALAPGLYHFTIEGLNWQAHPEPAAWISIAISR
jgi:hypothetical protein